MLKSCPKRLAEEMPKSGRFVAIYLDVDTEIEPIGEKHSGQGVKPFDKEEFVWQDGKLYYWNEFHWVETTPEKRCDCYKYDAEAIMFVPVPERAIVLNPVELTIGRIGEHDAEPTETAKRDAFATMYGGRGVGKVQLPKTIAAAQGRIERW